MKIIRLNTLLFSVACVATLSLTATAQQRPADCKQATATAHKAAPAGNGNGEYVRPALRANKLNPGAPRFTAPAAPMRLPGSNSVLCGAMVYNDLWGIMDEHGNYLYPITAGIYTIQAKEGGAVSQVKSVQDFIKMRAGVKVNSLYYVISTSDYDTQATLSTYYTSSWGRRSVSEIDVVNVPTDLTYDPVTGNVYGFFWNDTYQEYSRFCRFDTYYGEAYDIADVDRNGFAIAANSRGELYGIWGYTGWLIKINPATGAYEQIGRTGFSPQYTNSLTFDDATGRLYWCANDGAGESWLLEVDTATGAATEIMHFDNNASFAGVFAMPYKTPDAAPAAVEDITANFAAPLSLECTVTATAPAKTYNGADLTGPLTVAFTTSGVTHEVSDVAPGQSVTSPLLTLTGGYNEIEVVAATDDLLGAQSAITVWAGLDIPSAPAALTLEDLGGVPTLTWQAPATGANGGTIDPQALTYTVTRYPDLHTVTGITGTSWQDTDYNGSAAALWYTLRAVNTAGESEAATTAKLVFGQGFTVPFTETFSTADDFSLWSVFDLNGQTTWVYDPSGKNIYYSYSQDIEIPGDDWIISPRIALEAGKSYRLSAKVKSYYRGYPENFRFSLGKSCNPEAMTQTILECENFENPTGETKRAIFSVAESGNYHLGLYAFSIAHNWRLTVDDISLEEVSNALAESVADLTATAGERGAMEATLSFTLPTVASDGSALEAPLQVNIYRNHSTSPTATLPQKTPGEAATWTDTSVSEAGLTHYRVTVSNAIGEGADNSVEVWVGPDVAGAVTDLCATEQADGSVTLTWGAPAAGAHGGWYGDAAPTYRIIRSDGEALATDLAATTFTDNTLHLSRQELLYYLVTPYVDGVKGQYANTPWQVFGPAITAPLTETFPAADMTHYPWVSESDGPQHVWALVGEGASPKTSDQNGDHGMAMFISTKDTKGITGTLSSPKIDISSLENPTLSFWMWHVPACDCMPDNPYESLYVLASTDGITFSRVPDSWTYKENGAGGWIHHTVSLADYKGAKNLRIAFESTATANGSFYIDNITVGEALDQALQIESVNAPSRAGVSVPFPIDVNVTNLTQQMATVTATVRCGDEVVGTGSSRYVHEDIVSTISIPVTLATTGRKTLTVEITSATPVAPGKNTLTTDVDVVEAIVPAPKSLSVEADADNGITLSWLEPSTEAELTDDFESYPDWAIGGFGGYTMRDYDGAPTYYINKDLGEYPNATEPKAFQVCNAQTLGIDIWPEGTPYSGHKMLMSMASIGAENDDWLILPQLNGAKQTVSFRAKSFTTDDTPAERFRALYSMSDTDPYSFGEINAGEYVEVPDTWTLYTFTLPKGARWFAIQCVSDDAFALFIDDVSFNDHTVSNAVVTGYEVWRNGQKIGESEISRSFTDRDAPEGNLSYTVRAVYADGRISGHSNEATAFLASLDGLNMALWNVTAIPGAIVVEGPADLLTRIYATDGRLAGECTGSATLPLPAGIYTAVSNGNVRKLQVK